MMDNKLKILLVDDHAVVRAGFKMLLASQPFVEEIVDIDKGEAVVHSYEQCHPDVVVMDLSMPGIGGLEAIRRLLKYDSDATVLVYSIHDEVIYLERALQAGARGYVSKNSAAEVLAEAVSVVAAGERYIESALLPENQDVRLSLTEQLKNNVKLLSPREFDIFCLLAKGLTSHEIAQHLCLSYKTVANYNTSVKHKLNANTAAELANIASRLGLLN